MIDAVTFSEYCFVLLEYSSGILTFQKELIEEFPMKCSLKKSHISLIHFLLSTLIIFCSGPGINRAIAQEKSNWLTYYEKSNFLETPRYRETIEYCQRLDGASEWLQYTSFGKSPRGRELPLIIIDKNGNFTPLAVKKSGNAIVLIQNCIHAGEPDGKDASLMLARDMVINKSLADLLNGVTLLIIPIFNVDGHENFGPYNRINQNGPKEMGFRATAQQLNLNRDYLKADAPEMQAWLRLFREWLPDFLVDTHVTDGSDHQYAVTYGIEDHRDVAEPLRRWTTGVMEPFLNRKMEESGYPMMRYFWFKERPDIRQGLVCSPFEPRYSTGYGAIQNRVFYLIETHMLKDYRTRVDATFRLLKHILELCSREKENLRRANRLADEQTAAQLPGNYLPLTLELDMKDSTVVPFLGVDYTIVKSEISGGKWVQYGDRPLTYKIPLFRRANVCDSAIVPYAYLIPQEWQLQIERLQLHGIEVHYLKEELAAPVSSYLFKEISWSRRPFEGRHPVSLDVEVIEEERRYPAGTAVILMNQRTNRVAAHLLEPQGPDSFVKWGFWDTIFERKEYAEDYVLEKMARKMMAENPALQAEFEEAFAQDSTYGADYWSRLYFFYAKTPYWEKEVNVYPVGKLMQARALPLAGGDTREGFGK